MDGGEQRQEGEGWVGQGVRWGMCWEPVPGRPIPCANFPSSSQRLTPVLQVGDGAQGGAHVMKLEKGGLGFESRSGRR